MHFTHLWSLEMLHLCRNFHCFLELLYDAPEPVLSDRDLLVQRVIPRNASGLGGLHERSLVGTLATRLRSSLGVLKSVCLGLGVCCSAGRGAQAAGEQVGEGGGLRQQRLQSGIASDGVAAATGRILVNALRPQTQQEQ